MNTIIEWILDYKLDVLLIAIATAILTGLIKMPIKILAQRLKNSHAVTRFITFLPVFIGFGATVLGMWLTKRTLAFSSQAFYVQWLSAVSGSLAIYAFWEKFFPSKSKILSEAEISENQELIKELKQIVKNTSSISTELDMEELSTKERDQEKPIATDLLDQSLSEPVLESRAEKIILMGKTHVETTKES